jgi:hypothetical protein
LGLGTNQKENTVRNRLKSKNCILKINREDVTMKAYVINLKEEYDFLQGG